MATTEIIKNHASRLTSFLGLQRSTICVLAMVVLVGGADRCSIVHFLVSHLSSR